MAQQSRSTLKGYFNTGDYPTEAQFSDFIDSVKNLAEDDVRQTIAYSATPTHNHAVKTNADITLTGDVTLYTITNVPDGGKGTIAIIQDGTGGFGITALAHAGLTVKYLTGQAPIADNINAEANGHTILYYERIGAYLYVSFFPNNIRAKEVITATAEQTVVTFTRIVDADSMVFVNGNYVDDYTITDTTEITFPYGLNENDKITKK